MRSNVLAATAAAALLAGGIANHLVVPAHAEMAKSDAMAKHDTMSKHGSMMKKDSMSKHGSMSKHDSMSKDSMSK